MPWFEGTHEETFVVARHIDVTKAHFADPATIAANTEHLERFEVQGDVVHFVLKLQDHGVVKFKADYSCRYQLEGSTVRWSSAGGNTDQSGEAHFRVVEDGTEVRYRETIKVDLDINAMMAPMLKPLMGPMLAHEIKEYVKRMKKALA
jgi:hypothetical protein